MEAKIAAEEAKGKKDKGQMRFMSGKALFTYNPELFEDAEGAIEEDLYEEDYEEGAGEEEKKQNGTYDPNNIEETKEEVVQNGTNFEEDDEDS